MTFYKLLFFTNLKINDIILYEKGVPDLFGKWKVLSEDIDGLTAQNFAHNRKYSSSVGNGLLQGQKCEPVCAMRYGKYEMHHCGCEIIAVYNVMKLLHMPQDLAQLICEFEINKMAFLLSSAVFGSDPKKIRRFFDAHGVGYEYYTDRQHFYDNAARCAFGIVGFWINTYSKHPFNKFSSGLHTVMYTLNKQNGEILVYNRYSSDERPRKYRDLREMIDDRRFICGYLFPNQ